MKELETLLKFLLQMGWKPADFQGKSEIKISEDGGIVLYMYTEYATLAIKIKLRNLVSLESGLWQFVCSQKLLSDKVDMGDYRENSYGFQDRVHDKDGFYWMMRCARIPEEELGKFLIDNIKVKGLKSEQSKR